MNTDIFHLVEFTNRNVFLTGKAGTGKTTFLNEFVKKTRKNHIILAPTGIAAINAGGVTIHSMFGLPLRTFIPTLERIDENLGNNIQDLVGHFKYRKQKLKLLREVELIIIDEVSMLRADVLDMMDFSLRHIRRNAQRFGGVQMLFIGDLYQLPPVVREEQFLLQYYDSPFFFSAKSLENSDLVTVELTKIYRQTDQRFVDILNGIRESSISKEQLDALNQRYDPHFEPKEEAFVYLTSHNHQAESINQKKLDELKGKSYTYAAEIFGDFKPSQYPVEEHLELKVGTQIMFVRNDASSEKKYYNGKLAEVIRLSNDEIFVTIEGKEGEYKLKKEIWENKKYSLNAEKQIVEEVLGSFEQYPVRLAWAVTIHKSQGLTFDRVIIDAGKSFASGQVYVALSRCRTLEGIVLKSRISSSIIFNDKRVASFQDATQMNAHIQEIYENEKYDYAVNKLLLDLDVAWVQLELNHWMGQAKKSKEIDILVASSLYNTVKTDSEALIKVFQKFSDYLKSKVRQVQNEEHWQILVNKSKASVHYFFNEVKEKIFDAIKGFYAETKGVAGLKEHNEELRKFIDDVQDYLDKLQRTKLIDESLFEEEKKQKLTSTVVKVATQVITYRLFSEGKSVEEIAKERNLAASTIISHLAKYAENGNFSDEDLARIVSAEKREIFESQYPHPEDDGTLTFWKNHLPEDFDYGEIRLLISFFEGKEEM